jgi:hypothetical protein
MKIKYIFKQISVAYKNQQSIYPKFPGIYPEILDGYPEFLDGYPKFLGGYRAVLNMTNENKYKQIYIIKNQIIKKFNQDEKNYDGSGSCNRNVCNL